MNRLEEYELFKRIKDKKIILWDHMGRRAKHYLIPRTFNIESRMVNVECYDVKTNLFVRYDDSDLKASDFIGLQNGNNYEFYEACKCPIMESECICGR